ncbi:MAG: hypothetical protein HYY21_09360 [Candidatus Tectomicrobia bacterium]|nr:hypothetical protein [Candidatus Tectomicrobia bacterium]
MPDPIEMTMSTPHPSRAASRAAAELLEAAPWAIEFANASLSEENWVDHLLEWFGVSLDAGEESGARAEERRPRGRKSPQWHYGGMEPTLAHIHRTQESVRETLETLAEKGTVPRDVVERVNSYLMGLYGFKFHIISEVPPNGSPEGAEDPSAFGDARSVEEGSAQADSSAPDGRAGGKGVQPRTLRLEPKTFDLRSLLYYRFCLFLISAAAQRVRKCKECGAFFIQRFNHRKLYCGDLCRFRSHNRTRTEQKEKRKAGRRRAAASAPARSFVWWRKYEEKSSPG